MEGMYENHKQIDSWLFHYTEEEQQLKDYYRSNGKLLPREPERICEPQADAPGTRVYTDSMFIGKYADIAVVKHPRYLSRFDHSHTFFEISYVVEGVCHHTINAYGSEESVTLHTGDVLILPPSISHNILADGESIVVNILMRRSTFDSTFLRGIPENNVLSGFFSDILYSKAYANYLLFRTDDNPLIRNVTYNILWESLCDKPFASDILNQLLRLFFLYLLRECGNQIQISRGYHKEIRCIPAIVHYLEQHYATATIGSMADDFGYSVSHLCRLYKKHTGTNLRETLQQIRMRHASGLLRKSDWSVDDIAAMVGYGDVSSFIRRFRQQFHITPLQYRKQKAE